MEYEGQEFHFVFARDITERKKIEEKLRLTEYSVEHAEGMIFWLNSEGNMIFANDAMCEKLGYTREELMNMSIYDTDPNMPKPWSEHWERMKQKKTHTIEGFKRAKDGRIIPVEVTSNYVEYEGQEFHFVFARDITERKRMEKKLRLTEYSVEHADAQIFWVDKEGKITYATESTCKQMGYTPRRDARPDHLRHRSQGSQTMERALGEDEAAEDGHLRERPAHQGRQAASRSRSASTTSSTRATSITSSSRATSASAGSWRAS